MPQTAVSIIIATRNRANDLRETLASLNQAEVPLDFTTELLVVDNGSSDATVDVVKLVKTALMTVRYIFVPEAGKNRALNVALRECRSDIVLLTDDDVRVPNDWLEKMCRPLINREADVVLGGIKMAPHLQRSWMKEDILVWRDVSSDPSRECRPAFIGANAGFAKRALQNVPEFDEELDPGALGLAGDTLFGDQLARAGCRFLSLIQNTQVEHHFDPARLSRQSLIKRSRDQGRSDAYISYHWCHNEPSFLRFRLAYRLMRLWMMRGKFLWRQPPLEGLSLEESDAIVRVEAYRGLLIERRRPRQYTKFGLRKNNFERRRPLAVNNAAAIVA